MPSINEFIERNILNRRKGRPEYDAWLFWNVAFKCNLNCEYCNASNPARILRKLYFLGFRNSANIIWHNLFNIIKSVFQAKNISGFNILRAGLCPRTIAEINIPLLMESLDKTGKTFLITFTGGEPFVVPNFTEACREITKKHYVAIHSNLTVSSKIEQFADIIDPNKVLFIHGSLHIKELERVNLLDRYIENFLLLEKRGFFVYAMSVAYPFLAEEVDKYREFFMRKNIEVRFDLFLGRCNGKQYPYGYSDDDIKKFDIGEVSKFQDKNVRNYIKEMFYSKGKVCNAGYNVGVVWPSGDIQPCFAIAKDMGNIYKEIKFADDLIRCPYGYCSCPLNIYDSYLFQKALDATKDRVQI